MSKCKETISAIDLSEAFGLARLWTDNEFNPLITSVLEPNSFKKMQPMAAAEVALKSPLIPLSSKGELLNCGFNPSLEKRGRGDFDPTLRKLFNEF